MLVSEMVSPAFAVSSFFQWKEVLSVGYEAMLGIRVVIVVCSCRRIKSVQVYVLL